VTLGVEFHCGNWKREATVQVRCELAKVKEQQLKVSVNKLEFTAIEA